MLSQDFILSALPIILLILMMTKKKSVSSYVALPLTALLMYFITLIPFGTTPRLVHASVLDGLLTAWTPILIVWGAVFLFRTMERSGAMDVIRQWLRSITENPVAQLMIVGWAFEFLIEGASGFGTPAALAGPILVALGFPAVRVAILCLVMNTVPVSFGAVGTPTWFGFSELTLTNAEILQIGFRTALLHGAASLVIPVIALRFVLPWQTIKKNIFFIYFSILSCMIPYILLARISYESPAIAGGFIGLIVSVLLARYGIGLQQKEEIPSEKQTTAHPSWASLIKSSFPLWGSVAILMVTRIQELGLKSFLNNTTPIYEFGLGALGRFGISASLALRLENIFETGVTWVHKTLYVPSFIPFILVSMITFALFRMRLGAQKEVLRESIRQVKRPAIALMGALVFVKLLMMGGAGNDSSAIILGRGLATAAGSHWQFFAPYLGALGSFFAGSNTISNLTFGPIQDSIAQQLNLNRVTILAMQSAGGAMGNMVCINNIVAICSVLGIAHEEGFILKRTVIPMILYGLIVGIVGSLFV